MSDCTLKPPELVPKDLENSRFFVDNRTPAEWAAEYLQTGLLPVPSPKGTKAPLLKDWQNLRITPDEISRYWKEDQNVGVLNGEPSNGLVCADKDCSEVIAVAPYFFKPTLENGRDENPNSKAFYRCNPIPETIRYRTPAGKLPSGRDGGDTVVELLSTGTQAVVNGVHPTGDIYRWEGEFDAARITEANGQYLADRVLDTAIAAVLLRYYPAVGGRQQYILDAAGFLLRRLKDPGRVERVIEAAAKAAGDEEISSRIKAVQTTQAKIDAGKKVTGGKTLANEAPDVPHILGSWLPEPNGDKKTQADALIEYARDNAELFHTPDGKAYATIKVDGHKETWPIRSRRLTQWLVSRYYGEYGKAPSAQAQTDAKSTIEAMAVFDSLDQPVSLRVARYGDAIYLDLANDRWEAVEITADGWRVVADPPVKFVRSNNTAALPYPASGGGVDELRPFLNVASDDEGNNSFRLMVAWLVQALNPDGPYPILILQGEQGSAKSTAQRVIRTVVDPAVEPLRAAPKDERDLAIAASGNRALGLDNLSGVAGWLSDALCRLATGGGFATRELYTDDQEMIFSAKRPVLLNGITNTASRGDLQERSLIIELPSIPKHRRRREAGFWRDFGEAHPRILGALLDAVSGALANVDKVELEGLPRMADFAVWVTAAEAALGWKPGTFMEAYTGNREAATDALLEADAIAVAVRSFMDDKDEWEGTSTELLAALQGQVEEAVSRSDVWPKDATRLSSRLKRIAPALRSVGIEVSDDRSKRTRHKKLTKSGDATGDAAVTLGVGASVTHKIPANEHIFHRGDAGDAESGNLTKNGKIVTGELQSGSEIDKGGENSVTSVIASSTDKNTCKTAYSEGDAKGDASRNGDADSVTDHQKYLDNLG